MSASDPRPYHHGDLRRALIGAARRLLENEGPEALSLRAVARDAGVSAAAPYHHFKDKSQLLAAVAEQGFEELAEAIRQARDASPRGTERMTAIGVAYTSFALRHGSLYRMMSDAARGGSLSAGAAAQDDVIRMIREAALESVPAGASEAEAQMAGVAAWAAVHGLAELTTFKALAPVMAQYSDDGAFLRRAVRRLGPFAGR